MRIGAVLAAGNVEQSTNLRLLRLSDLDPGAAASRHIMQSMRRFPRAGEPGRHYRPPSRMPLAVALTALALAIAIAWWLVTAAISGFDQNAGDVHIEHPELVGERLLQHVPDDTFGHGARGAKGIGGMSACSAAEDHPTLGKGVRLH